MTKQISPAEIAKGMFVTVLENKPHTHQSESLFGIGEVQTITRIDRSGMGDVLRVLAVELPYIVVHSEDKYESMRFAYKVDTRRTSLMELQKDYVEAMCPHFSNDGTHRREASVGDVEMQTSAATAASRSVQ